MAEIRKSDFIWMDGKLVKWDDARIHVMSHALHYGSSVFEGIHAYKAEKGATIFRLKEHIERFFHSAGSFGMKISFTKKEIMNACIETLKKNKLSDAYIRPLAYYGYTNIGIFPKDAPTNVLVACVPWGNYYSKDLEIMTSKFTRHPENATVYGAKLGGNYANSILAMYDARNNGFDEALMLDSEGFVSEGPAENFFIVKDNMLVSPLSKSALPGITRDSLIKIAEDLGIKTQEKKLKLEDVYEADELFFCGTATEVAQIISIDKKKIGNGKSGRITLMLKKKFEDVVRGKDKKYSDWVTFV